MSELNRNMMAAIRIIDASSNNKIVNSKAIPKIVVDAHKFIREIAPNAKSRYTEQGGDVFIPEGGGCKEIILGTATGGSGVLDWAYIAAQENINRSIQRLNEISLRDNTGLSM